MTLDDLDIRLLALERVVSNAGAFIAGWVVQSPGGQLVVEGLIRTLKDNVGVGIPALPPGSRPVDVARIQEDDLVVQQAELELIERLERFVKMRLAK